MRQSQRQRERRYQSTIAPLQSKRLKVHSEAPCKQRNSIWTSDQVLEDVLKQWFQGMLPHVWYKIIPSSADDVNNIAFAMGQRWDLVSAVLIHLKFLALTRIRRASLFDTTLIYVSLIQITQTILF